MLKILWEKKTIFLLFVGLLGLLFFLPEKQDTRVLALCVIYCVAVTLFLVAQVVGFLLSHVQYSDQIEAPKFDILVNEEKEWSS